MGLVRNRVFRLKDKDFATAHSFRTSSEKPPVFEFAAESVIWRYRFAVRNRGHTWRGRYKLHDAFLFANRDKIKVFADVGAGNKVGAPTTIDARDALGSQARVVAIDRKTSRTDLSMSLNGVEQLKHYITRAPLPFQCDAIRLANVVGYMHKKDFTATLNNIWLSLKPRGFLLTAGPMESTARPKNVTSHNERVLIKVKKTKSCPFGFVELKLLDEQGNPLQ